MKLNNPSKLKRIHFRLLVCFLALVVSLVAGEILMRVAGFEPLTVALDGYSGPKSPEYGLWITDKRLGFRNRPDTVFHNEEIAGQPTVTIDSLGYRTTWAPPDAPDTPVVGIFGDSFTIAVEVADDDTPASHLAKKLSVRVVNGGVRCYNSIQSLRMMEETLDRYPDMQVVVYAFCFNDLNDTMLSMLPLAVGPTARLDSSGGLVIDEVQHLPAPEGSTYWQCEWPAPSFFDRLASWSALYQAAAAEGWLPKGRLFITQAEYHRWRLWAIEQGAWTISEKLLRQMRQLCERRGVKFLATCVKTIDVVPGVPEKFEAMCLRTGIPHVAVYPHFTEPIDEYLALYQAGGRDMHYGPKGAETFAAAIAPAVKELLREAEAKTPNATERETDNLQR